MNARRSGVTPGIEYRYTRAQAPAAAGDGKLTGLAAPFGQVAMIGEAPWGFRETIAAGAFRKALNDGDTVLLDNHDPARPIARRSAGTLELRETGRGLEYVATPANTSYGRDLVENVRAGNIRGNSFGFRAVQERWAVGDDGIDERTLLEVKLPEISACTFPAYEGTDIGTRDACSAAREAALERRGISPAELDGLPDDELRARFRYLMWQREKYSADDKKQMLAKGHALKNASGDASYPIGDADDLDKAIRAVGRGGADHDAIRRYIIGRAKALGLSSKIPDSWNADGTVSEANSAVQDDLEERAAAPDHAPVTGTHTHSHPAFGSQGGDDTHEHKHAHDGDANHDHSHNEQNSVTPAAVQRVSEPEPPSTRENDEDLARRIRAAVLAARMRRDRSDVELSIDIETGGTGNGRDERAREEDPRGAGIRL